MRKRSSWLRILTTEFLKILWRFLDVSWMLKTNVFQMVSTVSISGWSLIFILRYRCACGVRDDSRISAKTLEEELDMRQKNVVAI